jgi:hypothetical protein
MALVMTVVFYVVMLYDLVGAYQCFSIEDDYDTLI